MSEFIKTKLGSIQVFVTSKAFDKLFYAIMILGCLGAFTAGSAGEHLGEMLSWAAGGYATLSNATPSEVFGTLLNKHKDE